MTLPPAGTFMANVRSGVIQFPPPLKAWCDAEGWNLFRIVRRGDDLLRIAPVLPTDDFDVTGEFFSSLQTEGGLWIPEALRRLVSLGDQSVMMRVEDGAIHIYLRKVFETLGFRPV